MEIDPIMYYIAYCVTWTAGTSLGSTLRVQRLVTQRANPTAALAPTNRLASTSGPIAPEAEWHTDECHRIGGVPPSLVG